MKKVTATDLVSAISHLPRNIDYHYVTPTTRTKIEIIDVTFPDGPITIKRFNPENGGTSEGVLPTSISPQMIWRIANAFAEGMPLNIDRILGASYNTRSALEALIAHTPQFYVTYPGRIESIRSSTQVRKGHKHLVWRPNKPHESGVIAYEDSNIIISEMPSAEAVYDSLVVPDQLHHDMGDDVKRRHAQMQVALIMIGNQLGFRTWIAQNDKGILYKKQRIGEMETVVKALEGERLIAPFDGAIRAAHLIDCIWFKNGKLMPAVIEVEHSTGVTSGLTRMKGLFDAIPPYPTRYVIVAADEDRDKVVREINRPQFRCLNARYFPYSAVEELYALCQRRKIRGVSEEFLDSYMEATLN